MRHLVRIASVSSLLVLGGIAIAAPEVSVTGFKGSFKWYETKPLPAAVLKSLAGAKYLSFEVTFPADVTLTAAKGAYPWLSFLVADQGSDWKWHQIKTAAILPVNGNRIKAGKYTLKANLEGIPANVLKGSMQKIQFGPAASGISKPCNFTIDNIKGVK